MQFGILCRLVLEAEEDKEIPESSRFKFLEKFSANNFSLWDVEDNTSPNLLLAYASLEASIILLHQLLTCANFTLDAEDLFFSYRRKKKFGWATSAA